MSTAEERMQNEIDELEQENRLLRARNTRLERESEMRRLALLDTLKEAPVLSAGPITSEMANWSAEDKAELVAVIAKHAVPVQEPIGYFTVNDYDKWEQIDGTSGKPLYERPAAQRTWVGLTDIEYDDICGRHSAMTDFDFLEDIEAKLKEKNT